MLNRSSAWFQSILVHLSKHKTVVVSMSSTLNRIQGGRDKDSKRGTIISGNVNGSEGQHCETVGKESESTSSVSSNNVELKKLSGEEKEIYFAHKEACQKGENMYQDPATGYAVFTQNFLKKRGFCCGNACRHLKMPSADQMNSIDKNSVCAGCGTSIIERFYLMAVDREWHTNCLKCSECDVRLDNELTCFSKDGLILCREDYYKRFSVQKCSACSQGITSKELVMRAREHVYHIGCFACDRCKRMLATGEYFGMRGMRIYCKEDYEELLREETRSGKATSSSKGRPRKRRLAATIESVNALTGFGLGTRPEDLNGVTSDGRPKRVRTSFKHHQLRAMKAYFAINHNPDAKDLKQLSQKTGLTKRVLQVWFQNARAKFRRTVCNSQSPMSPSCDQLTPSNAIVETPGA